MDTGLKPTHSQIAVFLTDNIISEITQYLMEDYGYSLEEALSTLYSSKVLDLLQKEDCELYVQSPSYIYELLLKEKELQIVNGTVNENR